MTSSTDRGRAVARVLLLLSALTAVGLLVLAGTAFF
ncbi:putative membrane protein [Saccharothrix espanaensis DSM 44229]|uniref:Putative membrane protein n=1 Tax=Saccharothrix espanaensis (strain ATCC 51144 / DSM 44229 / JCM 9112 / NBRC 15066 / NRRL 15764) TaxID=1179773 RepID=K0JXN5_SACES|nr:putative membrane protein [Saccharothrix espanaensis DSM 44229]